jgi:prolipoprotein diacylglyceryltransferase
VPPLEAVLTPLHFIDFWHAGTALFGVELGFAVLLTCFCEDEDAVSVPYIK